MDILELVNDAKKEHLSFEKHPALGLDLEQKIHYLNGLALVMNVDDEIHDKEKEYMTILIRSFDLPDEKLDEFISFSENPDKKTVLEFIDSFKDWDIKYVFMFDCLMLAHKDDLFDEKEGKIIEDYFEAFKFTEREKEQVTYLYENILKQDKVALYRLFLAKDALKQELYTYLLDYYELNVKDITNEYMKEVKAEIKEFKFFKVEYVVGNHVGTNSGWSIIIDEPVSNKLFVYFLQYLWDKKEVIFDDNIIYAADKSILFNLSQSDISLNYGSFESKKAGNINGFSINGALKFIEWINSLTKESFSIPRYNASEGTHRVYANCTNFCFNEILGKQFYNELVIANKRQIYVTIKEGNIDYSIEFTPIGGIKDLNKILNGITFRLQK